jgi:nitroimidazol reductase NimA-like FMN-containing flavoprotein (pyridoxamine 5'-phosphate oxidase superfamily)
VDEVKDDKNWKSVMVLGDYQEIADAREYNEASRAFADRRLFLKISESNAREEKMQVPGDNKPVIFRIVIDEKKGRYENE